jgi:hypothetical protein
LQAPLHRRRIVRHHPRMVWRLLADMVLVVHALFIAWVLLGGFAALVRPVLAWVHIPAAAWGVWIEASGGICPLTPLEWRLRAAAGEAGHAGGFVEHYLVAAIYPDGLTREIQWLLAGVVLAVNALAYGALLARRRAARRRLS